MNKIGVYYSRSPQAQALAHEIEDWLSQKLEVWTSSAWDAETTRRHIAATELIVCVGGDGTVLQAARAVQPYPVPLLGIKVGRLGFLAELNPAEVRTKLQQVLEGGGRIEERAMLQARLLPGEGPQARVGRADGDGAGASGARVGRTGEEVYHALNDVVLERGVSGKIVHIAVRVDDTPLAIYRADAVIVATATGSTAYSLAAGGPILYPEAEEMVLTPVVPHLTSARSLVLPSTAVIEMRVEREPKVILHVDGEVNQELLVGEGMLVSASPHRARFLRLDRPSDYYMRLGRRLEWLAENRFDPAHGSTGSP